MTKPTPAATFERAMRLASGALFAVELQCRRLRGDEPEDGRFVLRKWHDFDFLVVALARFRRHMQVASRVAGAPSSLKTAMKAFDSAVPGLKTIRDVAEHADEYSVDTGHLPSIRREMLEVSTIDDEGPTLDWLGHRLNATAALGECRTLFSAGQTARDAFSSSA